MHWHHQILLAAEGELHGGFGQRLDLTRDKRAVAQEKTLRRGYRSSCRRSVGRGVGRIRGEGTVELPSGNGFPRLTPTGPAEVRRGHAIAFAEFHLQIV